MIEKVLQKKKQFPSHIWRTRQYHKLLEIQVQIIVYIECK